MRIRSAIPVAVLILAGCGDSADTATDTTLAPVAESTIVSEETTTTVAPATTTTAAPTTQATETTSGGLQSSKSDDEADDTATTQTTVTEIDEADLDDMDADDLGEALDDGALSPALLESILASDSGRTLFIEGMTQNSTLTTDQAECFIDAVSIETLAALTGADPTDEQTVEILNAITDCDIPFDAFG